MRQRLLFVTLCLLFLNLEISSAGVPRFPTKDDFGFVIGDDLTAFEDDIATEAPSPIQITHMRIRSEIALRYARTAVIVNVYNPNKRPQEANFHILLPDTAFISGFTMTVGNKTYDAFVKAKEEAKQIYNDAVSRGVSAAHVATEVRDSNQFQIKFNVEGECNATYRLRYEEFLERRNGMYNHAINLLPGALVSKMDVVVHIKESQKISILRVPEITTGNEVDPKTDGAQNPKAVIRRGKNEREATVIFTPDLEEQKRLAKIYADKSKQPSDILSYIGYISDEDTNENEGLLGQFVVQYDVDQPENGEILVNDGYFVHFFAPSTLPTLSKYVVFVLDTSYSMGGNKIVQLKAAMHSILYDLQPNDYFSIVEFNSYITVHRIKTENNTQGTPYSIASPENIAAAKDIVSRFIAYDGTDIYGALEKALSLTHDGVNSLADCKNGTEKKTSVPIELEPLIIFLTDGDPTEGETNTEHIITYLTAKNSGENRVPCFSLAFGNDADRDFLRKFSLRNEGFMRHIYDASDAALQLQDFYNQVSSPLLANVKFLYPRQQILEGSMTRNQFRTINKGSEVAVVGKIAEGVHEITPQIRGVRSERDGRGRRPYEINPKAFVTRTKDDYWPLERLWAYLTIKHLLDENDANASNEDISDDGPKEKALAIALRYSFVTPLTSLVVVRLNKTDKMDSVNAEEVDEPNFLPYRSAELIQRSSYTGISTGRGLTVASNDGPVLFAESTRYLTVNSYDNRVDARYTPDDDKYNHNIGQLPGWPDLKSSRFPEQEDTDHRLKNIVDTRLTEEDSDRNWGQVVSNVTLTMEESNITRTSPFLNKYHLNGFDWIASLYVKAIGGFRLQIESVANPVILEFTEDFNPPKEAVGDTACTNNTLAADEHTGSVCVYLTRCYSARRVTVDDYKKSYCFINGRYAGICCPRSDVDKSS